MKKVKYFQVTWLECKLVIALVRRSPLEENCGD
jgi:hypothetical protein